MFVFVKQVERCCRLMVGTPQYDRWQQTTRENNAIMNRVVLKMIIDFNNNRLWFIYSRPEVLLRHRKLWRPRWADQVCAQIQTGRDTHNSIILLGTYEQLCTSLLRWQLLSLLADIWYIVGASNGITISHLCYIQIPWRLQT